MTRPLAHPNPVFALCALLAMAFPATAQDETRAMDEIRLPEFDLPEFDLDDLENPLFPSRDGGRPSDAGEGADGEEPPPPSGEPPGKLEIVIPDDVSPAQRRLLTVARSVVSSVLSLRAYDRYGMELARAAGFFISSGGLIASDVAIVSPAIQGEIAYITAIAGDRTTFRIRGVWLRDPESGVALLQADAMNTPTLKFASTFDAGSKQDVYVVAFDDETRGLLLADAVAEMDESLAGQGWMNIAGEDSAGDPGSPVLNADAKVVGMVAMRLPREEWINFAVPLGGIDIEAFRDATELTPLDRLDRLHYGDITQSTAFLKAFNLLYERDYQRARRALLKLSRSYPRSAEVWALLGLASNKVGALEEAVACQRKAVSLDPEAGSLWRQLAVSEMQSGKTERAENTETLRETLEQAVINRPGDRVAWMLLAQSHIADEEWREADRALRQVVKIEPDYATGLYLLGFVRGKLGDLENATVAVKRSLALNSRNDDAWFFLGLLYSANKETKAAIKAFREATRHNPNHPNAWANLAAEYRKDGNLTEARLAIGKHIERAGAEN